MFFSPIREKSMSDISMKKFDSVESIATDGFSEEETEVFQSLLAKVYENMTKHFEKEVM